MSDEKQGREAVLLTAWRQIRCRYPPAWESSRGAGGALAILRLSPLSLCGESGYAGVI